MDLDQRVGEMDFSVYGREDDPLAEWVPQLQYLVSTLYHTDNNCPTVEWNIGKVCWVWRWLVKMLQWEGADKRVSVLF